MPIMREDEQQWHFKNLKNRNGEWLMKHVIRNLTLFAGKIDRQHVQLILLLISLSLLVIGAGAPGGGGSGNGASGGG